MPQTAVIEVDYGALLNKARAAQLRLISGENVASYTDQNGESVRYTQGDLGRLASYIAWLEVKCGVSTADSNGPMQVFF